MRVLDWNADIESTFAPEFGSEMLWLWTQYDKEQFSSCTIKGNVRLVLLTWNDKCDEDEYVITFRCGMTRVVVQEVLRAATSKHNQFVKSKSKTMKDQRAEALAEPTTPAYSTTHGFRAVSPAEVEEGTPPSGSDIESNEVLGDKVPADAGKTTIPASSYDVASKEPKVAEDENLCTYSLKTSVEDGDSVSDVTGLEAAGNNTTSNTTMQTTQNADSAANIQAPVNGTTDAASVHLDNPPPPPSDEVQPALTVALTVAELKQLWKEATAKEKAEKKKIKEATDVSRQRLRDARIELKDAMQAIRKKRKPNPKEPDDGTLGSYDEDSVHSGEDSDEDAKPVRKRLTQLEKWANGNKGMRERKDGYIKRATCDTWPEALSKLCQVSVRVP